MKIFLDTSSLSKLYHHEKGTNELEELFTTFSIDAIFLAEITKIEFASAIWKKVRTKEISQQQAKTTVALFESDCLKFSFIATDSLIIEKAQLLITKYGTKGLRTLDSLQLATAISLKQKAEVFITADKLLQDLFKIENLPMQIFH
ncbi:MAG: type II toxin-antitoxin system VapC family toxin [Bacteroidetes bacterium]|nr:type II toxin-antitoxin system VapC family toxin [Bacteroidota bacterium]MBS1670108.1 type II toxin-antitoxin system VapC family toxin [Bacteroidota bacterium]